MTTYYKIQHRATKRYSKGTSHANGTGNNSCWNSSGKVWDTLGKLRAHITQHLPNGDYHPGTDMSEWEVVEFEVVERARKPIHEIISADKLVRLLKQ